jgi:hypothetical protein
MRRAVARRRLLHMHIASLIAQEQVQDRHRRADAVRRAKQSRRSTATTAVAALRRIIAARRPAQGAVGESSQRPSLPDLTAAGTRASAPR